ncbi:MAG: acyl-CoA dehydrogenase family protein, partial [Candidatus Omnitrophota bacterium]
KMTEGRREAFEVTEEARQTEWEKPSFAGGLFMGRVRSDLVFPFPEQPDEDRIEGDAFLERLEKFLVDHVDADAIDRTGEMPAEVIRGLVELGCFGMKIPKEYGGFGFSQLNYNRAIALIASHCGSTSVWLSAHQSIGVPQPLKLFGTEEQKARYLPLLAKGRISAFALTEPDVGSDPAKMSTTAVPVENGDYYLLNGQKLWCTNGPAADIFLVMAQTPPKMVQGRPKKQITAFIVEKSMGGVEIESRCEFMGLKGIQNGLLRFRNVKVPKENILWAPGLGLKLAFITLNTGRLTLPAGCTGTAKRCLSITRKWGNERVQWGAPIGQHEANAVKLAYMASHTFAMESMTWLTSALADRQDTDIRLEAAMAKLFCTEHSWKIVDETVQIRGGRGYETASSLKARGEKPIPAERIMRDLRINLIIEGASEIMRLFIAREAMDQHMKLLGGLLKPDLAFSEKGRMLSRALSFYAKWYPRQWCHSGGFLRYRKLRSPLGAHMRYVESSSRRLARGLIHAMGIYQLALEKRQGILFRLVDIGTDLFAMSAACSRAQYLLERHPASQGPKEIADLFCRQARRRLEDNFRMLFSRQDKPTYRLGRKILNGRFKWLEAGIVNEPFD